MNAHRLSWTDFTPLCFRWTQKHNLLLIHVYVLSLQLQLRYIFISANLWSLCKWQLHRIRWRLDVFLGIRLLFLLFFNDDLGSFGFHEWHYDAFFARRCRGGLWIPQYERNQEFIELVHLFLRFLQHWSVVFEEPLLFHVYYGWILVQSILILLVLLLGFIGVSEGWGLVTAVLLLWCHNWLGLPIMNNFSGKLIGNSWSSPTFRTTLILILLIPVEDKGISNHLRWYPLSRVLLHDLLELIIRGRHRLRREGVYFWL